MAKLIIADSSAVSTALAEVQIQLLASVKDKARVRRCVAKHHYLGDVRAVGEQLFYAVTNGSGDWLGVLVFCAASRRLRARDRWIGWSEEQRRRRLPLIVNNCRFLLLPDKTFPNLGFPFPPPDLGSSERRLAGTLRPSGRAGRDLRRSRPV
jgi:hypothetical protein